MATSFLFKMTRRLDMGHINVFELKSDNELITLYEQFLDGEAKHGFSYDNDLGRIKLEYEKAYGASAMLMLQVELTRAMASRWYRMKRISNNNWSKMESFDI